jgi:hypothetical protein
MIQVSMREDHGPDVGGPKRQRLPVPLAQFLSIPGIRPQSVRTRWPPTSSRCFEPVTVRAAPRHVNVMLMRKTHLSPSVPEEHCGSWRKVPSAQPRDHPGHGLGRVHGIEQDALSPRHELQRFRRCRRGNAVAGADLRIVDVDLGCPNRPPVVCRDGQAISLIKSPTNVLSVAADSSALTPMTFVARPNNRQPATSPACVPPDEVE